MLLERPPRVLVGKEMTSQGALMPLRIWRRSLGLVAEAGEGLEEEGDVGAGGGGLLDEIDEAGFAMDGGEGEEAVEETDHLGVDVGGDVEGCRAMPIQGMVRGLKPQARSRILEGLPVISKMR